MQLAVTWIGHATLLAQLGGINLLIDPIFSERASPLSFIGPKLAQPPGMSLDQLPRIDAVVDSHNYYGHFDEASVVALQQQRGGPPLFIVPLGNKAGTETKGARRVVELDRWRSQRGGDVESVLTPVQHWSGRGLTDRLATLWGRHATFAPDFHLFHAGDIGYSQGFSDIRERFAARQGAQGFGLPLQPVGGYEPRARRSLGMHWGTYALRDGSLDERPCALASARCASAAPDEEFFILPFGETRKMPRRADSVAMAPPAQP